MIGDLAFFLLFLIKETRLLNIEKKALGITYAALMAISLTEVFLGVLPLSFDAIKGQGIFFAPAFFGIFLTRLIWGKKDIEWERKLFILFLLFSFSGVPFIFLAFFFFLQTRGSGNGRFFLLILLGILKVSTLLEDGIIFMLLVGLVFSCPKKNTVEDYAIKSYLIFLLLKQIDQQNFSYLVLSLAGLRMAFIFIKILDRSNMVEFSKSFFSLCVLSFLFLEVLSGINFLHYCLISIILLDTLYRSLVSRYLLIIPQGKEDSVEIRSILGNRNFVVFFIFTLFLAPLNPIFINMVFYLADLLFSWPSFVVGLFLFFLLVFLSIAKLSFFVDIPKFRDNPLPEVAQFALLGLPVTISVFFIPQSIGAEYLKIFFLLTSFYLLTLVLVTYFKGYTRKLVFSDNTGWVQITERIDQQFEYFFSFLNIIIEGLERIEKFLLEVIRIPFKGSFARSMSKFRGEDIDVDPSLGLGIFFIFLLFIVVYHEYIL